MRSIGQLSSLSAATVFSDFLSREGIESRLETNVDGTVELWVMDEESIPRALEHLTAFRAHPGDERFSAQSAPAARAGREATQAREPIQTSPRIRRREDILRSTEPFGVGPMSLLLLAACALVFVMTERGEKDESVLQFTISALIFSPENWLAEVRSGEVWRLVTPMLLHFGWLHLLCNALMILSLGSLFEARLGSFYYLGFVLVTSAIPNLAQYVVTQSPLFGGISGVAFALAGYAWIRGRFDPGSGISMPSQNVTMMMIYFVWCWMEQFGVLGSESLLGSGTRVANVVHTVGLIIGCAWGWLDAWRVR